MRSLGKTWKQMNGEQQQEFVDLFAKLLERTYMERIRDYNDEKVVFDKEVMIGENKAEVSTKIETQSQEIPILYRLYNRSGEWRVYDVLIENVSMVKNYRTQFTEFLTKKNVDDLLEHLRQKTSERADQSNAPLPKRLV
jgi:phospholipid transport system substrate-binding protein